MRTLRHGRVAAVAVLLGVGALQMLGLQPALAAHTNVGLYDYSLAASCAEGGSGTLTSSSAVVTRTASTISVTVQLVGATTGSYYAAELLQSGACYDFNSAHQFQTDGNGSGSVSFTVQAAAPPGQNPLIVSVVASVDCPGSCPPPPSSRSAVFKV